MVNKIHDDKGPMMNTCTQKFYVYALSVVCCGTTYTSQKIETQTPGQQPLALADSSKYRALSLVLPSLDTQSLGRFAQASRNTNALVVRLRGLEKASPILDTKTPDSVISISRHAQQCGTQDSSVQQKNSYKDTTVHPIQVLFRDSYRGSIQDFKETFADVIATEIRDQGTGFMSVDIASNNLGLLHQKGLKKLVKELGEIVRRSACQILELALTDNQIKTISPDMFDGYSHLRTIYLDKNNLTYLPAGIFNALSSLEILSLSGNQLKKIVPGTFAGLHSLKLLFLHGNKIAMLEPGTFDGLRDVALISLARNKLTEVEPSVFDGLTKLQRIKLRGNGKLLLRKLAALYVKFPGHDVIDF